MISGIQLYLRMALVFGTAYRAYQDESLTIDACSLALFIGLLHIAPDSGLYLALLMVFFLCGNAASKYKLRAKSRIVKTLDMKAEGIKKDELFEMQLDPDFKVSDSYRAPRTLPQVFCNSGVAALLIFFHLTNFSRFTNTIYAPVGVVAQYAAVLGDTLASEIGILSTGTTVMVGSFKPCPKGTNGGITLLGTVMSLVGGAIIGTVALLFDPFAHRLSTFGQQAGFVAVMAFVGLFGSMVDSFLGATLQLTLVTKDGQVVEVEGGSRLDISSETLIRNELKVESGSIDMMTNNKVNFFASLISAGIGMHLFWTFFDRAV